MGAHLVNLALARWAPHISDTAFRVLIRMAVVALDSDGANGRPAGLYFGGRELLAMTLRAAPGRSGHALNLSVGRAVNELVKAGAIERVGKAHTGHRQTYRLLLGSGYPQGLTQRVPQGLTQRVPVQPRGTHQATERYSPGESPRNKEEPQPLGAKTGTRVDQESDSRSRAREQVDNPQDRSDKRDDVCPDCGAQLDPDGTCFVRTCNRYGRMP